MSSNKPVAGPDYKVTVDGTYYAQGELGKMTTRPYQEEFFLMENHIQDGALSIIVNGFKNQPVEKLSLLRQRLVDKDPTFRGVRTHEIVHTERLNPRPAKAVVQHDVSIMSEDMLLDYAAQNGFEIDFGLYDQLDEKRAAVAHFRANPEEYHKAEAELRERFGPSREAAKTLEALNEMVMSSMEDAAKVAEEVMGLRKPEPAAEPEPVEEPKAKPKAEAEPKAKKLEL